MAIYIGRKILPITLHLRKPKTEVRILNYITESFYFF